MIYKDNNLTIFFGDSSSSPVTIGECRSLESNKKFIMQERVASQIVKIEDFKAKKYFFLSQTHSVDHIIINSDNIDKIQSFEQEGDFLVTNQKNTIIGVLTADCLPIIFFDSENYVLAIAHAGWKGTVANIVKQTINSMRDNFETMPEKLKVIFGPNAKKCCYEVSDDFFNNLDSDLAKYSLVQFEEKQYFDLPAYNKLLLLQENVIEENINLSYNNCTICNVNYCSYRRKQENSGLQMTLAKIDF